MWRWPRSARRRARSSGFRPLLVVVIGDVADHLQGVLVERQQPIPLHRYGAAGNRVGVEHASDLWPRHIDRARYREPAAVDLGFRGLDLVALGIDLDKRRRGNLVE